MSVSVIIVPVVVSSWPTIAPALVAAASALGFSAARQNRKRKTESGAETEVSASVEVENTSVVGEELEAGQSLDVVKDDLKLSFGVNRQGQCQVTVSGKGRSKEELQAIGQQAAHKVVQMYTYNKVMTELKNRDFQVLEEEVDEQGAIRLKLRRS